MTDRLQKLLTLLERSPDDTFVLYGVGLEYKKCEDFEAALQYLERTISVDPGYCYAYFQKGQVLEQIGRLPDAKASYEQGIRQATLKNDAHARSELESALAAIA